MKARSLVFDLFGDYLRSEADRHDPYAAPLRSTDLSRLPAALVITAGYDVLRDEAEHYAARLGEAGVAVELAQYPGLVHGFFGMAGQIDEARRAVESASAALRSAFGDQAASG